MSRFPRRRARSGGQGTLASLGWNASSQFLQQFLQFGFSVVLARTLDPADFGLIAMMTVFTGFLSIFVDLGLGAAIIQRPEIEDRHLTSAFWLNIGMGTSFMLLVMALAPALAAFYGHPRLLWITLAYAPAFLIGSLVGVQDALLQRGMEFRKLFYIENSAFLASNLFAVCMALAGLGVWSLVAFTVAGASTRAAFLWISTAWRPTGLPDRASIKELWRFGSRLTGFNALNYWARNADNLLIGRFLGSLKLAYYNRAYTLMMIPSDLVSSISTRVMYPVLSRLQADREEVKRVYLRAMGMIMLVSFPAITGLFVLTRPFIDTVYGPHWVKVAPLLQILCIGSVVQILVRTTGWIFMSQDETGTLFRLGVLTSVTAIAAFAIGLPWGVRGVTIAYACWAVLSAYPIFYVAGDIIDLSVLGLFRAISGPVAASIPMGVAVWVVANSLLGGAPGGVRLVAGIATGVVSYVAVIVTFKPAPYLELMTIVRRSLAKRRGDLAGLAGT